MPQNAATAIAAELHNRAARSLWVLDGVRPGLDDSVVTAGLGPHPLARTIITTRDRRYAHLGVLVDLRPGPPPGSAPSGLSVSAAERAIAWRLQVELAYRIREVGSGHLRGALAALYGLFLFVRRLLADASPTAAAVVRMLVVLHLRLRPLLTYWHPTLKSYEQSRTRTSDPVDHESRWNRRGELENALAVVRAQLAGTMADLAVITGSRYGIAGRP
ncbi:hypothetical protein [Fodinicola feengrottensis]|uniref:hypothetical protein n=1 Tax=Fodinicola feengrottensis TaxID=435914 RepID=UPI002441DBD5|nr:hypothetical protein [Fodinicola feengrottensis]